MKKDIDSFDNTLFPKNINDLGYLLPMDGLYNLANYTPHNKDIKNRSTQETNKFSETRYFSNDLIRTMKRSYSMEKPI